MQVIQQPSATTLAVQANIRWRHSTMLMATAAACMLAPTSAKADSYDWWQKQTTDQGCYAYAFDGSVSGMASDPQPDGFIWSGNCTPNAPINGEGIQYRQTKYAMSEGDVLRRIDTRSGRMVNGFWDGPIKNATYDVDESGKWSLDDPLPVPADMVVVQYRMGCPDYTIDPSTDYGCAPGQIKDPINIPRVSPAYYAVPGLAKPVAPPTPFKPAAAASPAPTISFSNSENNAFDYAASELLATLGAGGNSKFASDDALINAVVTSLEKTFLGGGGAAIDGDLATLNVILKNVRTALAAKGSPGSTGQILDQVMGIVRDTLAISKHKAGASTATTEYSPAAANIAPAPVAAIPAPIPANLPFERRWSVRDAGGGCKIILRDADLMWDAGGENINGQLMRIEWNGSCDANGLAKGFGALVISSRGQKYDGRHYRAGVANSGLLNGGFKLEDQYLEGGSWQVASDDGGLRRWTDAFANGCTTGEYADPQCNSADAINLRDNFLIGRVGVSAIPVGTPKPVPVYQPAPVYTPEPTYTVTKPTLLSNMGSAFAGNYPLAALRAEQQGRVTVQLSINSLGAISQCIISGSSGVPSLDTATCDIWYRVGRFAPAIDSSGRTVDSEYSSTINWVLP